MGINALADVFPYDSHKYRVMQVSKAKTSATVAFYIDARDVMDRLDSVAGPEHWSDCYKVLSSAAPWIVECTLTVGSPSTGSGGAVAKVDVGEGDDPKSAYSDALKRAAVKFGVGRYLYGMDTGGYLPIDEYKAFTPDSVKRIEALLRRNLEKLQAEEPSARGLAGKVDIPSPLPASGQASQPLPTVVEGSDPTLAGWQVAPDEEPYLAWQGPTDAYEWAISVGACENEFEARNSFKKVVDTVAEGRYSSMRAPVIFAAFYQRQMEKLVEKQPVAA